MTPAPGITPRDARLAAMGVVAVAAVVIAAIAWAARRAAGG